MSSTVPVDGFGDSSVPLGTDGAADRGAHSTFFPHSLVFFYLAFTQYLGFMTYGDEYKVMGLAAYGEPDFIAK